MGKFGEKTREARLRWYGHLRRKDDGYIGKRMLRMELPGKMKRGRAKRRFMEEKREKRRNFYLKSNKMVNTTLANSLLRRLHTQYVQHNIQYLQQIYK